MSSYQSWTQISCIVRKHTNNYTTEDCLVWPCGYMVPYDYSNGPFGRLPNSVRIRNRKNRSMGTLAHLAFRAWNLVDSGLKSNRFHPWNPADFIPEIWQISFLKSGRFHEIQQISGLKPGRFHVMYWKMSITKWNFFLKIHNFNKNIMHRYIIYFLQIAQIRYITEPNIKALTLMM